MNTLEERFWEKVHKTASCWTWTARVQVDGYGRIQVAGRSELAHRIAWELSNGQIPKGMHVCHRCDNPPCVRPDHLFIGAPADNVADKVAKGRQARGANHNRAKLSEDDVLDIRAIHAFGARCCDIARAYGILGSTVTMIIKRANWAHLP